MKNSITSFLLLILVFSCSKNDFLDTKLRFETDKETYLTNDKFELKIFVYPTKEDKTIRFNKNLNNLNITFFSTEEHSEFHQELKKHCDSGQMAMMKKGKSTEQILKKKWNKNGLQHGIKNIGSLC